MQFHHILMMTMALLAAASASAAERLAFQVTIDRGEDVGQCFGSLFEAASEDGSLVIGAGFPNDYNTRTRGDRHAVQFFVRPKQGDRPFQIRSLPRPNDLCGTYLFARDGVVYSTYGGVRAWDARTDAWRETPSLGGTEETMRVGEGVLEFGDSFVTYKDREILAKPSHGSYQLFFYANGHLCFYHVDRREGGYRPYRNDQDGFSKLYACPWTPREAHVDLSRSIVLTLPVVGETTFAWGQLGGQIITGSNVGGFYIYEDGRWRMLLEPNIQVSYQLYSTMSFFDRLLMGQYPTGRLFEYDGQRIADRAGWPPKPPGVSGSAREAQTTAIYGGEIFVGVWPWGELWRYNPDSQQWTMLQRMFSHPELSDAIVHPYDVENKNHQVTNLWGQRVTSLVLSGDGLFISTSAKSPTEWRPEEFPFLAPDKWKSYGSVYRLTMPGHVSAPTAWTTGPTTLEFTIQDGVMAISQDGARLVAVKVTGSLADELKRVANFKPVQWGHGIYGKFSGVQFDGKLVR